MVLACQNQAVNESLNSNLLKPESDNSVISLNLIELLITLYIEEATLSLINNFLSPCIPLFIKS